MTEEHREILIGKIVDSPSSLSAEEIEAIMTDRELAEMYETLAMVQGAYRFPSDFDMDKEWNAFRPLMRRKHSPLKWAMRVAAAIAICVLAYPVIDKINNKDTGEVAGSDVTSTGEQHETSETATPTLLATAEPEEMLPATPVAPTGPPKSKRTPKQVAVVSSTSTQNEQVDVDEYLRIQKARIENELAMQNARIFEENYSDIEPWLELLGVDNTTLSSTLKNVTMQ